MAGHPEAWPSPWTWSMPWSMPPWEGYLNQADLTIPADLPAPWLHALVQDHLNDKERYTLFQVSWDMAAMVLQHAPRVHLELRASSAATEQQQHVQQHVIERLLATAPKAGLDVCLCGDDAGHVLPLLTGTIRQQLKHLTLGRILVTEQLLQDQLQLQHCHRLQTLVLDGECLATWTEQQLQWLTLQALVLGGEYLPPSLTRLEVQSHAHGSVKGIIRLLARQLTYLAGCIDELHGCGVEQMQRLVDITLCSLDDTAMDCLATLPKLTHVTVTSIKLHHDHTSKHLGWQQLSINSGARGIGIETVQPLPLRHIKGLVIHGSIRCTVGDTAQQHIAHLASCPSLQCVPHVWPLPAHPEFIIFNAHAIALTTLCVNSMTGQGGLYLQDVQHSVLQQLLHVVPNLPCRVEALRLRILGCSDELHPVTSEQRVQVMLQLVASLPPHVKQLTIEHVETEELCLYVSTIISRIQYSQQPIKLVVALLPGQEVTRGFQVYASAHDWLVEIAPLSS